MKKSYKIVYMDRPNWEKIQSVELSHTGWLHPSDISAKAQMCYNNSTIFVRLQAEERHIRAKLSDPLDRICDDSCMEFFFAPIPNDNRFFNFEWNPLGALYLGFSTGRKLHVRQIISDVNFIFSPQPFNTENGWGIEFEIPVRFIQLYMPEFEIGKDAEGNFYKCGDKTKTPHYLAWSPLSCNKPDFHRRQDFGTFVFD